MLWYWLSAVGIPLQGTFPFPASLSNNRCLNQFSSIRTRNIRLWLERNRTHAPKSCLFFFFCITIFTRSPRVTGLLARYNNLLWLLATRSKGPCETSARHRLRILQWVQYYYYLDNDDRFGRSVISSSSRSLGDDDVQISLGLLLLHYSSVRPESTVVVVVVVVMQLPPSARTCSRQRLRYWETVVVNNKQR